MIGGAKSQVHHTWYLPLRQRKLITTVAMLRLRYPAGVLLRFTDQYQNAAHNTQKLYFPTTESH